jgi:hypothetical protein
MWPAGRIRPARRPVWHKWRRHSDFQVTDSGHGFVQQVSRELLLPLLPTDARSTPGLVDGRPHNYVGAPIAEDVPYNIVPPAREDAHGQILASRGPAYGVLSDMGQQQVCVDQEPLQALAPRWPPGAADGIRLPIRCYGALQIQAVFDKCWRRRPNSTCTGNWRRACGII